MMSLVSITKLQLKGHCFQDISEIHKQLQFPKFGAVVLPSVTEFWAHWMNLGWDYLEGDNNNQ
jgi:hypothetical protein